MKKYLVLLALTIAGISSAQAVEGNVAAGKNKSAMCAACHGPDGNSAVSMYPKLAGQHAKYLATQLHDFKAGLTSGGKTGRADPVMGSMAMALTDQDIADLAAFYQSQTISAGEGKTNEIGKKLYLGGDNERGITACIACHGVNGQGVAGAGFPAVASQNVDYLKIQLRNYRDLKRTNDSNSIMRNISAQLEEKDIEALAQYMSSLK